MRRLHGAPPPSGDVTTFGRYALSGHRPVGQFDAGLAHWPMPAPALSCCRVRYGAPIRGAINTPTRNPSSRAESPTGSIRTYSSPPNNHVLHDILAGKTPS